MKWIKDKWFLFRVWLVDKLSYDMGFMKNLDIVLTDVDDFTFSLSLSPRITGDYLYYSYNPYVTGKLIVKWRGRVDRTTIGIGELK